MRVSIATKLLRTPLLFLLIMPARAQDARDLLGQSAERYRALESYDMEADVTVVTTTSFGEQEFEMRVRMAERPPAFVRAEVDSRTMRMLVIMNDDGSWIYLPEQNEYAFAEDSAPSEIDAVSQDLLGEYAQLDQRVARASVLGQDSLLVDGLLRRATVVDVRYDPVETAAGADSTEKRLWIDVETGLVLKDDARVFISATPIGEPMRVHEVTRFTRIDIEGSPEIELFSFVPPEGAKRVASMAVDAESPMMDGGAAPDFSLQRLDGPNASLADHRGKVVLLNFWATWCGPCLMEMPELENLHAANSADGLVVLGVNLGEPETVVSQYVRRLGFTFPVLLDVQGDVGRRYEVHALPTTVVVDRDGRISTVLQGAQSRETFLDAARSAGL